MKQHDTTSIPRERDKEHEDDELVQRPDLAEVHGTDPTEETHREGEHKPEDTQPDIGYTGEHGSELPRRQKG